MIYKSTLVDFTTRQVAIVMKQSIDNLELEISDIEVILSEDAMITTNLSTADDISVTLHIAVNGPVIDWPFAEAVLERYLFLGTEELGTSVNMFLDNSFSKAVWKGNCFKRNLVKLLGGGSDFWRVRKSLELLLIMVGDKCIFQLVLKISVH